MRLGSRNITDGKGIGDTGEPESSQRFFWAAFAVMFFASIIFGLLQIINMRP